MILLCLFAHSAGAQSRGRDLIAAGIDSLIRAHALEPLSTNIVADSSLRSQVDERYTPDPHAIVFVQAISLGRVGTRNDQVISASGTVISLKPPQNPQTFTITRHFTPVDETESSLASTTKTDDGFWGSILQPALVTLGAVAIVALFFLIRS